jgi:hypothetical protein
MGHKFSFEDVANSPIVKQTEEKITQGYQEINGTKPEITPNQEIKQPDHSIETPSNKKNDGNKLVERRKSIVANLNMSLYNKLVLYKLETGKNLGEIAEEAIKYYMDHIETK